jgi:hypothetical protein
MQKKEGPAQGPLFFFLPLASQERGPGGEVKCPAKIYVRG